jgi:putative addiction module CopG family antidote
MLGLSMALRETITISVPPELRAILQGCIATGRYSSVSEVVRAALR